MSFNSTPMIHHLRTDFEQLLTLVTGPDAHTATVSQMERSLFRQVLRLGLKLLQLFLMTRVAAESRTAQLGPDQTRVPYHAQKPRHDEVTYRQGRIDPACGCAKYTTTGDC